MRVIKRENVGKSSRRKHSEDYQESAIERIRVEG